MSSCTDFIHDVSRSLSVNEVIERLVAADPELRKLIYVDRFAQYKLETGRTGVFEHLYSTEVSK